MIIAMGVFSFFTYVLYQLGSTNKNIGPLHLFAIITGGLIFLTSRELSPFNAYELIDCTANIVGAYAYFVLVLFFSKLTTTLAVKQTVTQPDITLPVKRGGEDALFYRAA